MDRIFGGTAQRKFSGQGIFAALLKTGLRDKTTSRLQKSATKIKAAGNFESQRSGQRRPPLLHLIFVKN